MDKQAALLLEYSTVRANMKDIIDDRNKVFEYSITVALGAVGVMYSAGVRSSNLYLIPVVLLVHAYFRYHVQTVRFLKMNAYLIEVVERQVDNLQWHTWEEAYRTKFFNQADSKRPTILLMVLFTACFALARYGSVLWSASLSALVILILASEYYRSKNTLEHAVEEWRRVAKAID